MSTNVKPILDYWLGIVDCVCDSDRPIGGCLSCDLLSINEVMNTNNKVLFLDFDGVIRVPMEAGYSTDSADFCPERMNLIYNICRVTNTKVVVSSDWRQLVKKEVILDHIGKIGTVLHDDWKTEIKGRRYSEIKEWLDAHPEVDDYAIIDDYDWHFEGASDDMLKSLVLCNYKRGVTKVEVNKLFDLLANG